MKKVAKKVIWFQRQNGYYWPRTYGLTVTGKVVQFWNENRNTVAAYIPEADGVFIGDSSDWAKFLAYLWEGPNGA